ncbi:uncharacterized protein LOC144629549 [Oculina patagonica]
MDTFSATFMFFVMSITGYSLAEFVRIYRDSAFQYDDFLLPSSLCPGGQPKCSQFNGSNISSCRCGCNEMESQTSAFFEPRYGCTKVSSVRQQAGCQLLFSGETVYERLTYFPSLSVREKNVSVPANQRCSFFYGKQFHVQYLDCTGSWRSITQQSVLDTLELTPGWSTTHLKIRIKGGSTMFQTISAGRLVRVAIQCQTLNRLYNTSSCVVFQVNGYIECPYPQSTLSPGLTKATLPTLVPQVTAPSKKPTTSQTTEQPTTTGYTTKPFDSTKIISPGTEKSSSNAVHFTRSTPEETPTTNQTPEQPTTQGHTTKPPENTKTLSPGTETSNSNATHSMISTPEETPTTSLRGGLTPVPPERRNFNKDVVYGTTIAALAMISIMFVLCIILRRRRRKLKHRPSLYNNRHCYHHHCYHHHNNNI